MLNQPRPRAASEDDREPVADLCSREVAEHLVRIADLLPGVIYALRRTPDGTYSIPYASAALEQMFGFEPGELSAEPSRVFSRVVDEDLAPLLASIDASAASLTVWGLEFRIVHPDLGLRTILGKSTPERDREGNTIWFGFATDVTDSIENAAESRRRKRLLEAVISNSPSVLSIKDLEGRYVLANPNLQMLLGRTEAEILGTTVFDHFDRDTARRITENDARVMATNHRISVEERVVAAGAEVVFASYKFPIPDERGAPAHICSISLDVTERRRAERELTERELLFRSVFDQQFQFMAILSPDGRVREISDLPLRVLQASREDYVGQFFWLVPGWRTLPEWHAIWKERLQIAAQKDGPVLSEDTFLLPDGSYGHADAATTAVRDADGNLQFFIIQASDTTARKRAQVALRSSEEAYRTLLDSMGDGVFVAQQDGIAFANPALAAMLGYTSEELSHSSFARVVAPESLAAWQDAHQRALHDGDSTTVSLDLLAKDGTSRISVELRARSVSYLTQPGVLGIVRDIGARLRSDAALRESESRFRQLAENLREVFWLTDVSKEQLLYVSPGYESIWAAPSRR